MPKPKKITVKSFEVWLEGLSKIDRMNFEILINLPNAESVIAKAPEGEYRSMAIFALAVVGVIKEARNA